MSGECHVNVKSQSELDIGGRETCPTYSVYILMHSQINHGRFLGVVHKGSFIRASKIAEDRIFWFVLVWCNHTSVLSGFVTTHTILGS